MGIYTESEVHSANGRMDALVRLDDGIICCELKLYRTAEESMDQIESKGYLEPYRDDGRRRFGIGVNFSTQHKPIEELLWKEY